MIQDKINQIKELTNNYNIFIKQKTGNMLNMLIWSRFMDSGSNNTLNILEVIYNDSISTINYLNNIFILFKLMTLYYFKTKVKNTGQICSIDIPP